MGSKQAIEAAEEVGATDFTINRKNSRHGRLADVSKEMVRLD